MVLKLSELADFSKTLWKSKVANIEGGGLCVTLAEKSLQEEIAVYFDIAGRFPIATRFNALFDFGFVRWHPKQRSVIEVCINGQRNKFDAAAEDKGITELTDYTNPEKD